MGAKRWLELGPIRLQPSEMAKITVILAMAAYYDWLDIRKNIASVLGDGRSVLIVLIPVGLVLRQPDLGTALLILGGGGLVIFFAGVSLWYFGALVAAGGGSFLLVSRRAGPSGNS
jgi:rod shape determining protein RodA